jgi:cystathionine beta-lyase/cystathionine gamma-synthase
MGEDRVTYPGLPSHPQHALACTQMTGFGGMLSVEMGSRAAAAHVLERVRVFALAESLGRRGVADQPPALMTHASVPARAGARRSHQRRPHPAEAAAWRRSTTWLADLEHAFAGLP